MEKIKTIEMTCEICGRTATVEDGPNPEGFHAVSGHIVCYPKCLSRLEEKLRQKREKEIIEAISIIKDEGS